MNKSLSSSQLERRAKAFELRTRGIAILDHKGAAGAQKALALLADATTIEDELRREHITPEMPPIRPYTPRAKLQPIDQRPIEQVRAEIEERSTRRRLMPEVGQLSFF